MRSCTCSLVVFSVVLTCPVLRAAQLPFDVSVVIDEEKTGKEKVDKGSMGEGDLRERKHTFAIKLRNSSRFNAVKEHIDLHLYVVTVNHAYTSDQEEYKVDEIFHRFLRGLKPAEEKVIEMGSLVLGTWQTGKDWRGGRKYDGYVLEIWLDGKLKAKRRRGGSDVRKAYERVKEQQKKAQKAKTR